MPYRKQLAQRLPRALAAALSRLNGEDAALLTEIRIRAGAPAVFVIAGRTRDSGVCIDDIDALLASLCGHALYGCEGQLAQGYLPLPGGHRAGVCGAMARGEDGLWRMGRVSSVCIRVARCVPGASNAIRPLLLDEGGRPRRVLLLGAPGCGKTTVLRDMALYMAKDCGMQVAVADEREELFPQGEAALDVIGGMDKARAIMLLLRSMAPQVIVTDEIGRSEDADALQDAVRCGVGVLATAHAGSLAEAMRRPVLRRLFAAKAFDCAVLLGSMGRVREVVEKKGDVRLGQLGCGGDGDDGHQRERVPVVGWGEAARALDSRDAALSAAHERRHPL